MVFRPFHRNPCSSSLLYLLSSKRSLGQWLLWNHKVAKKWKLDIQWPLCWQGLCVTAVLPVGFDPSQIVVLQNSKRKAKLLDSSLVFLKQHTNKKTSYSYFQLNSHNLHHSVHKPPLHGGKASPTGLCSCADIFRRFHHLMQHSLCMDAEIGRFSSLHHKKH